jgi:hypothetical protein
MTISLLSLLDRVVKLQKAIPLVNASAHSVTADAQPILFYTQGSFPYWVNRIEGPDPIEDDSEMLEYTTYDVIMRLVVDHLTAGVNGERELDLYAYIPIIKDYFAARRDLKDDTYTTELTGLNSADIRPGGTGLRIYQQSGIGAVQVGCEFRLRCVYTDTIYQVHY